MDVEKKKGVYDFMVRVGWVTPRGTLLLLLLWFMILSVEPHNKRF